MRAASARLYAPGVIQPEVLTWKSSTGRPAPGSRRNYRTLHRHAGGNRRRTAAARPCRRLLLVQMLGRSIGSSARQAADAYSGTYMDISVRKQVRSWRCNRQRFALLIASENGHGAELQRRLDGWFRCTIGEPARPHQRRLARAQLLARNPAGATGTNHQPWRRRRTAATSTAGTLGGRMPAGFRRTA